MIHFLPLLQFRVVVGVCSSCDTQAGCQSVTDQTTVMIISTATASLESPVSLTWLFWDCGRKPQCWERTHTERPQRMDLDLPLLWPCNPQFIWSQSICKATCQCVEDAHTEKQRKQMWQIFLLLCFSCCFQLICASIYQRYSLICRIDSVESNSNAHPRVRLSL